MAGPKSAGLEYRPSDFEIDGALRDVCVLNAAPDDWQAMLDGLGSVPWAAIFTWTLSSPGDIGTPTARDLWSRLESDPEESVSLAIQVGDIWFTSYFFEMEEIEFTFDPADVVDAKSFSAVAEFIRWLGDSTNREVIVTMEGNDHGAMPPLLQYPGKGPV